MHDAEQESSDSLPPIGAKFCAKVTNGVVVELASVLEEQASLLVLPDFHAFMCSFEVQRQSDELAVGIIMLKRACDIHAGGQANMLRHEAQGIGVADRAVQDQACLFALSLRDIKLAPGSACRPGFLGVLEGSVEFLHPTVADFFAYELVQQLGILFSTRPVAGAAQEVHVIEVILLQVRLALGPLHAGRNGLEDAGGDPLLE